jgi:SAM-dependent methyltransferase
LVGVDPAIEQIEYARRLPVAEHARFTIADATALPFADGCFDVITSALVINFIPDRPRALAEMRRVAKPGGLVALYVWDLAEGGAPTWPMTQGMRSCGIPPPQVPGVRESTLESLQSLFERTGFESTEARRIEVTATYHDFDDFWTSNTPAFSPMGRCVAALTETDRLRLRASVASALPVNADGSITYAARANAIKGGVTSRPRGGMSDPNYRMSSNVSGST